MKPRTIDVARRLSEHPLLAGAGANVAEAVLEAGVVETKAPGESFLREGHASDHYFILLAGTAKVTCTSADGFEVALKVFEAPASFGEMEVLTHQRHVENCIAVDRATALKIPRGAFERLLEKHPLFTRNILVDLCAQFVIAAEQQRALAFFPVAERLANLLLSYVRIYGVPVEGGTGIRIPLSQADLAADLGVAKKSITRTMAEWREASVVEQRGRMLVVKNLDALKDRAEHGLVGIDWSAGRRIG